MSDGMFGHGMIVAPERRTKPAPSAFDRLDSPLSALAMTLGPALMAYGFNMPQLANMGPSMLGMAAQAREADRNRELRERELKIQEGKAAREAAMRDRVSSMFLPPPSGAAAASGAAPAAVPGTEVAPTPAPGMLGAPSGGMFEAITPSERATASMLAQSDPDAALKFAADRAYAREKLGQGTTLERNIQAGGLTPGTPEYEAAMMRAVMPSSPTVNVAGPAMETAEAKEVGKFFGQQFTDLQQAGSAARQQNQRLQALGRLLDQVYTGTGGEAVLAGKRLAQAMGYDPKGIGEAEAAQALANEFALQLRNPAGGAGMPGAMSDRDREFLQSMTPGLSMTKEGRDLLIEIRKRLNKRDIEVARLARDYRRRQGRLDEGFYDELDDRFADQDLFQDLRPGDENVPAAAVQGEVAAGMTPRGAAPVFDPRQASYEEIQSFIHSPAGEQADPALREAISKRLEAFGK